MIRDVHGFRRRLRKIRQYKNGKHKQQALQQLQADIEKSVAVAEQRRQHVPVVDYPDDLPIAQKSEQIRQTIASNQVTVLCGETGSGKTTQLPKICLDIGRGICGQIAHTQPRRLAARTVSARIADELQVELGRQVGFKVRFTDESSDDSYIKLMTDGILLAECRHDPYLARYDTIIIDEAHERSLNIDFLLGYLKRLLPRRPELKVIITSATIDPERFARHFDGAPVINVSGRTWPVEVRYRPLQEDGDASKTLQQGVIDALEELSRLDRGDVLVFLSGERDIRETQQAIVKHMQHAGRPQTWGNTEVLPLLARLSSAEQNRIFHPSGKRRIVLATNVAETSLTVPGIKYVIDSGLARISRYSWRSKIQRLPIEKISRAAANQRKGRCGRVSAGVCIRLYDEEDFNLRPEYTEPEIQRTSLAAVILQMEYQRLGHVENFPFVDPPQERLIKDGYKLLYELGAVDDDKRLTRIGRMLARLPVDPKLARMLLQAEKESALTEVLVIVSALAVQDIRERPLDWRQAADEKHAAFAGKDSDFVFYLNLWQAYHEQKKQLSNSQLRKWCKQHFVNWLRMREWIDTHRQIRRMLQDAGLAFNRSEADDDAVHRSLLTGLLANVGLRDEDKSYQGARNTRFYAFPGSALFKFPPKWLMAAELVETTRVYARTAAKIDPLWLETCAAHLLKRHAGNPHWEKRRGKVVSLEQASLYGLIVYAGRRVDHGRINAQEAREIFIRDALVTGDIHTRADFYRHNRKVLDELKNLEAKSRRRDIIDEHRLYEFYDARLPAEVYSVVTLEKWLRRQPDAEQNLLLKREQLLHEQATVVNEIQFPDSLEMNGCRYPLQYHFDPNHHCDGVTLITPVAGLRALDALRCEWMIPGLLHEKMVALIRSLPKQLRKNFVPAPNFADACMEALQPCDTGLCHAMAAQLQKMTGVSIPYDAWRSEQLPAHLLMNFRVVDADGNKIGEGRDLAALRQRLAQQIDCSDDELQSTEDSGLQRDDVGAEAIDELKKRVELTVQGVRIRAWPALVVSGSRINLRTLQNAEHARTETRKALRQLFINALGEPLRQLKKNLPEMQTLALQYREFGGSSQLYDDIVQRAVDELFLAESPDSQSMFEKILEDRRAGLSDSVERWRRLLAEILVHYHEVKKQMKGAPLSCLDTVADIQQQLQCLLPNSFFRQVESDWLMHYPRYLKAIRSRLDKAQHDAGRDRKLRLMFAGLWQPYLRRRVLAEKQGKVSNGLRRYRWMLEEYRVSLFAQELRTAVPVSEKRLKKAWNEIDSI